MHCILSLAFVLLRFGIITRWFMGSIVFRMVRECNGDHLTWTLLFCILFLFFFSFLYSILMVNGMRG